MTHQTVENESLVFHQQQDQQCRPSVWFSGCSSQLVSLSDKRTWHYSELDEARPGEARVTRSTGVKAQLLLIRDFRRMLPCSVFEEEVHEGSNCQDIVLLLSRTK